MKKGSETRANIIKTAANIFNTTGFAGASISSLMQETGLKKGGIYNHFTSKDEIIEEAFNYAVREVKKALYQRMMNVPSPKDRMNIILDFYREYPMNPVIKGGCPLINTSIDADNTHPQLKLRVKEEWQKLIANLTELFEQGKSAGEFRNSLNSEQAAVYFVATIQGGIVLTRTMEQNKYMFQVADQLQEFIAKEVLF